MEYSERPVRFIIVQLILEGLEEEPSSGEILQQNNVGRCRAEEGKVITASFPDKLKLEGKSGIRKHRTAIQKVAVWSGINLFLSVRTRHETITKSRMSALTSG